MSVTLSLPRYDRRQTYDWNYANAPDPVEVDAPAVAGAWKFCGRPVPSPLGVPAGPLLNGRWVLYYASLGFDVLTYKTVRSRERECYPLPNLLPVRVSQMNGDESDVPVSLQMQGSWAVSFGMPSKAPDVWRADVEWTRDNLPTEKLLSVSVVGTMQEGWSIDELADDYALCARWAVESGADLVETNFSCPNVSTCDGQLYQDFSSAALVAGRVREAIGSAPYLIKIGRLSRREDQQALIAAVGPYADALAMTNSIATTVIDDQGRRQFDGQRRGICGQATRTESARQTAAIAKLLKDSPHSLELVGVGGAASAQHVQEYLDAGATAVHIATAAMTDPAVALKIRAQMA